MENEILPSISALFDYRVAQDVLRAAREVYGMVENMRRDRKKRDRQWHLLRMAKRVGLTFLPPDLARRVSADATGRRL
jgi:hypothetical protein